MRITEHFRPSTGERRATAELRTLRSLVEDLADHGERPALTVLREEGAESLSYAELAGRVDGLARGLAASGVHQGDHVALLAENGPEWVAVCLGVLGAGAVAVPLDAQLSDDRLRHALDDSGAGLVFTTTDQAGRVEGLGLRAEPGIRLLDAGEEDERSWRHLLSGDGELPEVGPGDPAVLFYTSGTTGASKGVPLTHGNLAFQLNALIEADLVTGNDRVLLPLPLHHVYPFVIGLLTPLSMGLAVVVPRSMTGPELVRALREGEVTLIAGVPRLYSALYSGIEEQAGSGPGPAGALFEAGVRFSTEARRRLGVSPGKVLFRPLHRRFGPKLRVLASGGAALDEELAWKLQGLGWQVAVGYGLTETSPILTLNPPGTDKPGSAGRPVPGVELALDPSAVSGGADGGGSPERTTAAGRVGEILARGPGVFSGYRNLPGETEEAFTEDGWYRTKDLGYFDPEGYLYVTGRASTMIVTEGGENVQPEDVESVYLQSPVIKEFGVLEKQGRLVAVAVPDTREVRNRGEEVESAIREAVSGQSRHLPSYSRVSDYAVTREPLEYTQLGKLRRHVLQERYERARSGEEGSGEAAGPISPEEMSEEDRELLGDPVAGPTWDLLARRYPDVRLIPDTSLQLDLGVDSMEWVNLTLEIGRRTGVELDETAIERIETVRDFLREVAGGSGGAGSGGAGWTSPLESPEEALGEDQRRWLEPLGPGEAVLARGLYQLNRETARRLFGLEVEGAGNLPEEGPFVIAPNHVSYLDSFALAAALGYRRLRGAYWGGWTGAAFGNPATRYVSRLARVVPVDPDRAGVSSLAFAAAVLQRGEALIWYPEGERSPTGRLQAFRPGLGLVLVHHRVPVVPVFIRGTEEAMPRGELPKRLSRVRVAFGEPLGADDLENEGPEDLPPEERIVRSLRARVAELGERP